MEDITKDVRQLGYKLRPCTTKCKTQVSMTQPNTQSNIIDQFLSHIQNQMHMLSYHRWKWRKV